MIATYVQAMGKIVPSMVIQVLRQGVLLFPLMWLLNNNFNIMGIWWSFPLTEFIVFAIAVIIVKMNKSQVKIFNRRLKQLWQNKHTRRITAAAHHTACV